MKNNYDKKFSIAHPDATADENFFLECFENASNQWRNEIYDIYFGTSFLHQDISYGDTMGVNASPGQYRKLLTTCRRDWKTNAVKELGTEETNEYYEITTEDDHDEEFKFSDFDGNPSILKLKLIKT